MNAAYALSKDNVLEGVATTKKYKNAYINSFTHATSFYILQKNNTFTNEKINCECYIKR